MNATKIAHILFSVATATLQAIAILTIYPESQRQKEIAAAKRSIAERKAQVGRRKAEVEVELRKIKAELASTLTPEPQSEPTPELPALPNPWELEADTAPTPIEIASTTLQYQLCLPVAPELKPKPAPKTEKAAKPKTTKAIKPAPVAAPLTTKEPTIRELKAIASERKIRGYGNMSKTQLLKALALTV